MPAACSVAPPAAPGASSSVPLSDRRTDAGGMPSRDATSARSAARSHTSGVTTRCVSPPAAPARRTRRRIATQRGAGSAARSGLRRASRPRGHASVPAHHRAVGPLRAPFGRCTARLHPAARSLPPRHTMGDAAAAAAAATVAFPLGAKVLAVTLLSGYVLCAAVPPAADLLPLVPGKCVPCVAARCAAARC